MKSHVLLLALLHSLGCSGIPLSNPGLESLAERGLAAALVEINSVHAVSHLYRVTRASVTRMIPLGLKTADLVMVFDIKETECVKASGDDPQTCAFRPGFFVPSLPCSSRVRMSATSAKVVSLRCGHDSSSSESSEELFSRGSNQFNIPLVNRAVPDPSAPSAWRIPPQPAEARPRGDTLPNFVV
ncbi:secreted phosphoprotein 24 [Spinachia spinachia]